MIHQSTKTYGHELGFSCAFRQWKAHSHCRLIHGYALAFKFTFEAEVLDDTNWVVDFGGLKGLKAILENTFDHTLIIAEDDPERKLFESMSQANVCKLVVLPAAGCEKFAEYVYEVAEMWLYDAGFAPRCTLVSVEVSEHGANSAIYKVER